MIPRSDSQTLRVGLCVHHHLDVNTGAPGGTMALASGLRECGNEVSIFSLDDFSTPMWGVSRRVWTAILPALFPRLLSHKINASWRDYDVLDFLTGDGCVLFPRISRQRLNMKPLLITYGQGLEHLYLRALREVSKPTTWREMRTAGFLYRLIYERFIRLRHVKRSYKAADAAVFSNRTDRSFGLHEFDLKENVCFVSPNGIPDYLLGLPVPSLADRSRASIGIAVIGVYSARKGIEYGAPALCAVLDQFPSAHVKFLGTNCDADGVLRDFDSRFHSRIVVVERYDRKELPDLIADCEINFFPTIAEGFGMALVEGMACGLAPVTTQTPGPMDIILDGQDGLIVPPRDASSLRDALVTLLSDDSLRFRVRTNAQRRAQDFSWGSIAEKRDNLYRRLLNCPKRTGAHPAQTKVH